MLLVRFGVQGHTCVVNSSTCSSSCCSSNCHTWLLLFWYWGYSDHEGICSCSASNDSNKHVHSNAVSTLFTLSSLSTCYLCTWIFNAYACMILMLIVYVLYVFNTIVWKYNVSLIDWTMKFFVYHMNWYYKIFSPNLTHGDGTLQATACVSIEFKQFPDASQLFS